VHIGGAVSWGWLPGACPRTRGREPRQWPRVTPCSGARAPRAGGPPWPPPPLRQCAPRPGRRVILPAGLTAPQPPSETLPACPQGTHEQRSPGRRGAKSEHVCVRAAVPDSACRMACSQLRDARTAHLVNGLLQQHFLLLQLLDLALAGGLDRVGSSCSRAQQDTHQQAGRHQWDDECGAGNAAAFTHTPLPPRPLLRGPP
jgi:hypothetical protein